MSHPAIKAGNVAVITGAGAGGIGAAIAQFLAAKGLKLVLADISQDALDAIVKELPSGTDAITQVTDVTKLEAVKTLQEAALDKYGQVDLLFLNAGTSRPTVDFSGDADAAIADWNRILDVNFTGVLNGTQVFVDGIVKQGTPGAVVITGSKQGITCPPGNPAYNVSKAAVKALTESLAHTLIPTQVTAHLLVPGFTWTKLVQLHGSHASKPPSAWTPEQVAEELFSRIGKEFYIICPDNDVPWSLDAARIEWNAGDILNKRPALSRWHPDFAEEFKAHVASKTSQ